MPACECARGAEQAWHPHPSRTAAGVPSLLGTELQDEAQFWVLSCWLLAQSHSSLFCLFFVHCVRVFSGGFQRKFLKLWKTSKRTSKRQDGLADFQDAGLSGKLSGEGGSLLFSHFVVPHKLLGKCQVTTRENPILCIGGRSGDQGAHLLQTVSLVSAETGSQAS